MSVRLPSAQCSSPPVPCASKHTCKCIRGSPGKPKKVPDPEGAFGHLLGEAVFYSCCCYYCRWYCSCYFLPTSLETTAPQHDSRCSAHLSSYTPSPQTQRNHQWITKRPCGNRAKAKVKHENPQMPMSQRTPKRYPQEKPNDPQRCHKQSSQRSQNNIPDDSAEDPPRSVFDFEAKTELRASSKRLCN